MEYKISGYRPEKLFQNFEDFSAVPRGSFHNEQISAFLVKFANDRGLEVYQDEALNVIIKKPGQHGGETCAPVILQGHMDMVCEKVHGCDHDFETQGIDMFVTEDGWLTANGTTLGGDDGIADAMMMTILEDRDIPHPPLECVFTTDEEVGLLGAEALDYAKLEGRRMINIDSEDEGIVTVSCAGGMDVKLTRPVSREEKEGYVISLSIRGLLGGHSGTDIDLGRTNADKLIARALARVLKDPDARLVNVKGGTKGNAIPREAEAEVWFPAEAAAVNGKAVLEALSADFYNEIHLVEPDITCVVSGPEAKTVSVLSKEDGDALLGAVLLSPNGVRRRDPDMDNFVLTSLNLGILSTEETEAVIWFAPRSSIDSLQEETLELLQRTADTFGFETATSGAYPGWEKVEGSPLVAVMVDSWKELFDEELTVAGIHAGLECGLFYKNLPGLDPVSIGPTMRGVHTPDEKMDLKSCEKTYTFLVDVLARLSK